MKLGFNLLLWTAHVTLEHEPLLRALKDTGYDGVEIPLFEGDPDHYARLGELLDRIGLERIAVSVRQRQISTRSYSRNRRGSRCLSWRSTRRWQGTEPRRRSRPAAPPGASA